MQRWLRTVIAALVCVSSVTPVALAQADPPARVGRISFLAGTVSFHDADDPQWSAALLNHPVTSGGALWTEPNGRAELVVGGSRVRLQGSTELEVLALDDAQFRLRLAEGRIDLRVAGVPSDRPYEILTPRGTVSLLEDGDYLVEAGGTTSVTRIGVRRGLAQFTEPDGRVVNIRAGEIGVASGTAPVTLAVQRLTPPPMPAEWAGRDRVVVYRPEPQYVSSTITGHEDLDTYGSWQPVSDYGPIWVPRYVPAGWAPYRHGRWVWVRPWGWTWVDDSPWGFAPFHYGRWIIVNHRWCWVPPARHARPVYAPALVGFVGGPVMQIGVSIGRPSPAVGWFPLGPREVYVPPYSANRGYIRGLNGPNVAQVGDIDRRLDHAERRGERRDDERWTSVNQRHATVVPADAFVRSRPVQRAALPVPADQLARADVAPVAAPPVAVSAPPPAGAPGVPPGAPTVLPGAKAPDVKGPVPAPGVKPPDVKGPVAPADSGAPVSRTTLGGMPTLGRPDRLERPSAPGPVIARPTGPAGTPTAVPPPVGTVPAAPPVAGATGPVTPPVGGAPAAPPVGVTPPTGVAPPAGATSPATPPVGGAPAARAPVGAPPPAAVAPPAGTPPRPAAGAAPSTTTALPSSGLPPLRGPTAPASPKATEPSPTAIAPKPTDRLVSPPPLGATPKPGEPAPTTTTPPPASAPPPAPTVIAPRPPERIAPPPTIVSPKPPESVAPPPATPQPTTVPLSTTTKPPERLAPPPPLAAPAPRPAPPPPPPPQAAPAPRPAPPPPPPPLAAPAPRPAPPPPPPPPAPVVKPTVPPPPPPQPQQQQQQQQDDERRKGKR